MSKLQELIDLANKNKSNNISIGNMLIGMVKYDIKFYQQLHLTKIKELIKQEAIEDVINTVTGAAKVPKTTLWSSWTPDDVAWDSDDNLTQESLDELAKHIDNTMDIDLIVGNDLTYYYNLLQSTHIEDFNNHYTSMVNNTTNVMTTLIENKPQMALAIIVQNVFDFYKKKNEQVPQTFIDLIDGSEWVTNQTHQVAI